MEKLPSAFYLQYLPALGRARHELPWSFVPAAVAPILTRAGVRLLRQADTTSLAHLKKRQPSAVLPLPAHPSRLPSSPTMSQNSLRPPPTKLKIPRAAATYTPATMDPDLRSQLNMLLINGGHDKK